MYIHKWWFEGLCIYMRVVGLRVYIIQIDFEHDKYHYVYI